MPPGRIGSAEQLARADLSDECKALLEEAEDAE
jgi:hypothetical protein